MTTENQSSTPEPQSQSSVPSRSKIPNITIINVALLVGLLVLYAIQFFPLQPQASEENSPGTEAEISAMAEALEEGAFHIAYVNSDTLMNRYKLAVSMRNDFEAEQRRLENNLQTRQQTFQDEVESFQRQAQLGLITREQAQTKEQELMLQQQELVQLNDTYANRLMVKEAEMNQELYLKITDILERFNQEMGYDYILGFTPGGGILYAKEQHDITEEILSMLNSEYDATN